MRRSLIALSLFCLTVPPAWAGTDLRGVAPSGYTGSDTAVLVAAGDVNGDGRHDLAAGLQDDARTRDPASLTEMAVVGFGPAPPDPTRPGFAGLVVTHLGEPALLDGGGTPVGGSAAGVGDFDGDGLDDVAFGAIGAGPNGRASAGSVYIVLGRREPGTVDARTDPRVVRIDGPARGSLIGMSIAPAGDFDGDGRADVVIGLRERAVIVRGGAAPGTPIDLARPPAGSTIELRGLSRAGGDDRREAATFAAAGDVDGDGRGELLVALPPANPLRGRRQVLVVRGAADAAVDATRSPLARIVGPRDDIGFGSALATLPDTDGDGRPEWVIGDAVAGNVVQLGENITSGAFVVFSRARGEVRPGRAGQPVVRFVVDGDDAGRSLAGIPDATGDGVPDLLLGRPEANPRCRSRAGALALVPGRRTPGTVRVDPRAPRIDGPNPGAKLGENIAFGGGEIFAGTLPFQNAASLELWRLPMPTGASPPLPRDCLKVRVAKRTREQLLRDPTLRVTLRSDAGDGRAHRVRASVQVLSGPTLVRGSSARVLRFRRAGSRSFTLRLPRRAAAALAGRAEVNVYVGAEQRVGSGIRAGDGAVAGDGLRFRGVG